MRNATLPELVCPLESYKFCERNSKSRRSFCVKFFLGILIEINFFNMFTQATDHVPAPCLLLYNISYHGFGSSRLGVFLKISQNALQAPVPEYHFQ